MSRPHLTLSAAARLTAAAVAATLLAGQGMSATAAPRTKPSSGTTTTTTTTTSTSSSSWTYKTLSNPARVQVFDGGTQPLATFTNGARTVTLRGPSRTFAEPGSTTATVTTTTWVRLLPQAFGGTVDGATQTWLTSALADRSPDVLAIATGYITGAPTVNAADGTTVSSDASYGPLQADGTRAEGSDFNDYLGRTWTYTTSSGTTTDAPEADQIGSLDCSGFVRMVYGYRLDVPMTLTPDGTRLPRRSFEIAASAPGVVTVPNTGTKPTSTAALAPGDLLFWDASTNDGTQIDHVGIYLGTDSAGAPRFISSRKTVDGPTLGDVGGKSLLSGTGLYATSWRAARRL
jgi:cell wall-associated NlpC family hydrolase